MASLQTYLTASLLVLTLPSISAVSALSSSEPLQSGLKHSHLAPLALVAQNEANATASNEPQRTSATFSDWVVRCDRTTASPPKKLCEAVQTFTIKGKDAPFAQIVFTHILGNKDPVSAMTMLLVLPVNLALDKQPTLTVGADAPRQLQLLRCLPEGCVATLQVNAELIKQIRSAKNSTATFFDASGQKINLPLSSRGYSQALDDLSKESASL